MIKGNFCTPRLRSATAVRKTSCRRSPAMSLLHRLRDAVFRLIMLSAISKNSGDAAWQGRPPDPYYYPSDSHQSEAVADCIEFIKKSATRGTDGRHESTSAHTDAVPAHVAVPLAVK